MGGSLDVLGQTRPSAIFGRSALAGFEENDGVSEATFLAMLQAFNAVNGLRELTVGGVESGLWVASWCWMESWPSR